MSFVEHHSCRDELWFVRRGIIRTSQHFVRVDYHAVHMSVDAAHDDTWGHFEMVIIVCLMFYAYEHELCELTHTAPAFVYRHV